MKIGLFIFLTLISCSLSAQRGDYGGIFYNRYATKSPDKVVDFAVKGDLESIKSDRQVHHKYSQGDWHFIRCTSSELSVLCENNFVTQIYK